jgi:hypothetical protein
MAFRDPVFAGRIPRAYYQMTALIYKDLFTGRWRKMPNVPQKESQFQIELVQILRWCVRPDVIWRHVPNGEHRDPRTAAKLKAMGVLPGAADLEFHWCDIDARYSQRKLRKVLHLELKVRNRQASGAQDAYRLAMMVLGDGYKVVRSIDEALEVLEHFRLLRPDRRVTRKGKRT